jgi:acid phosphatase family membrane protein YuiD
MLQDPTRYSRSDPGYAVGKLGEMPDRHGARIFLEELSVGTGGKRGYDTSIIAITVVKTLVAAG